MGTWLSFQAFNWLQVFKPDSIMLNISMYQKIFSQIQGISANQIIEIEVQIAMAHQKVPDMKKYLKNM